MDELRSPATSALPLSICVSIHLGPVSGDIRKLAGVLGNFFFDLSQMTSVSAATATRIIVAAGELLDQVLERQGHPLEQVRCDVLLQGNEVFVSVDPLHHDAN